MNWLVMGWTFCTAVWAGVAFVNTRSAGIRALAVIAVLDAIVGFILAAIS